MSNKTRWCGQFIPKTGYTHSLFISIMTSQRKWKEPFLSGSSSGPCQNHKISEKIDWHFWKKTFCCYSIIARPLHTTYFLFMKPTAKSILWVSDGWLLCKIVGWVLYEFSEYNYYCDISFRLSCLHYGDFWIWKAN